MAWDNCVSIVLKNINKLVTMQLQYQGYDINKKFKYFEMFDGIYELENLDKGQHSKQFIWTAQTFSFFSKNITKINFRIYSHIQNILILNDFKFDIPPNTVLNITLDDIKDSSRILGSFVTPYTPITSDLRELGVMLYCITVDGTDLY